MPRRAISLRAVSITVRVLRPRKSNFTSPAASAHFMLNWVAGKLRARVAIERHQLDQRPIGDDHARGMGRGMAVEAFEALADIEQLGHDRLGVARLLQTRLGGDGLRQA